MTLAFASNQITATFGDFSANAGIIVSRKENASYKHNDVVLVAPSAPAFTSDEALPTYPTGTQRFLNGGGKEEGPFSPTPEPTPTTNPVTLSDVTTAGNSIEVGANWSNGSSPFEDSVTGVISFNAAHVADNGGAKAMLVNSLEYKSGGTQLKVVADGANTISSRSYQSGTSVWVVPVTGSPVRVCFIQGGGD